MSNPKRVDLKVDDISRARAYVLLRVAVVDQERGCWDWRQNRLHGGHGQAKWRGHPIKAHRLSYAAFRGEPGDLNVLHKCDNPACCNPDHHFLGTKAENNLDAYAKGRYESRKNRLTREQYDEIVRRLRDGEAQIPVAHSMGIDAFHVQTIASGEHWACRKYGDGSRVVEDARSSFKLPAHNTSGYRGVSFSKKLGKWSAKCERGGKVHYFGLHETPEAAHAARLSGIAALEAQESEP